MHFGSYSSNISGHSVSAQLISAVVPDLRHLQSARHLGTKSPLIVSLTLNSLPLRKHLSAAYVEKSGHLKLWIENLAKYETKMNCNMQTKVLYFPDESYFMRYSFVWINEWINWLETVSQILPVIWHMESFVLISFVFCWQPLNLVFFVSDWYFVSMHLEVSITESLGDSPTSLGVFHHLDPIKMDCFDGILCLFLFSPLSFTLPLYFSQHFALVKKCGCHRVLIISY